MYQDQVSELSQFDSEIVSAKKRLNNMFLNLSLRHDRYNSSQENDMLFKDIGKISKPQRQDNKKISSIDNPASISPLKSMAGQRLDSDIGQSPDIIQQFTRLKFEFGNN